LELGWSHAMSILAVIADGSKPLALGQEEIRNDSSIRQMMITRHNMNWVG